MWILLYLILVILVSLVIYLGTLVVVNQDVIFYRSKPQNKEPVHEKPKQEGSLNVISRAEKLTNVRHRRLPELSVDQSVFVYKPSYESVVTKRIYDFLASREDKTEKWVLYTHDNKKLNGYIYPHLEFLSPDKPLEEYNVDSKPMNVILVFKEYMSYIKPIEYLQKIEGSKYYMPMINDKHDYMCKSDGMDVDGDEVHDLYVNDINEIELNLDNAIFRRAYFKVGNLKDFLRVREMIGGKYDIHYDSNSVIHIERAVNEKIL